MIADSPPVDGFNGSLGVVRVKLAPLAGFFRWFSQRLAVEREAVRGVHELAAIFFGEESTTNHAPSRIRQTEKHKEFLPSLQ
jgi:hypothetical protein